MTTRLPDPGRRVGSGRLRVDAARAIAKLREYQLPERTMWVLEAVRAAVASGARRIELAGDSDDVWLAWEGEPWPGDVIAHLFDELVSPSPGRDAAPHRLLATAVNSALGLKPAHVDVHAIAADGTACRVRYTPDLLTEPSDSGDEPRLRELSAEPAATPERAIAPGMLVHVRRSLGLDTLGYLLTGSRPELEIARQACADIAVPLTISGVAIGRAHHARDRIRLPLGGEVDGFLALTAEPASRDGAAVMEIAEHGVMIARYTLPIPELERPRAPLPLRLYVDGRDMPTSASRSEVRCDVHPVRTARERALDQLSALVDHIAKAVVVDPDGPERADALRLLAAAISGDGWPERAGPLAGRFGRLARLPLLRDATGRPRAPTERWRKDAIYAGREPVPTELAPYLDGVLWLAPGDPGIRLLGNPMFDDSLARRLIRAARKQHRARARFERRPVEALRLDLAGDVLVGTEIGAACKPTAIPSSLVAGASGQLCLLAAGRGGRVRLLWHGREIETISLASPLPFSAVIDASKLTPEPSYRALARDNAFARTTKSLLAAAVRAAEGLALARAGGVPGAGFSAGEAALDDEDAARLFRDAFALALDLGVKPRRDSPLQRAAIWPAVTGDWHTTADLRRERAIGTVAARGSLAPVDGRIAIAIEDPEDGELLRALLEPGTAVVDYPDEPVAPDRRARDLASQLGGAGLTALAVCEPGVRGAIAWGTPHRPLVILFHAGRRIAELPCAPELGPCVIWVDCDAAIPSADWSTARDMGGADRRSYLDWERQLASAVARRVIGDDVPGLFTWPPVLRLGDAIGRQLCQALQAHEPASVLGAELVDRLARSPLVATLGGGQRSPAELAAAFDGAIEYVETAPTEPALWPDGKAPVLATPLIAWAVAHLVGRLAREVSGEIVGRARDARRAERLAAHRARPVAPLALPTAVIDVAIEVNFQFGLLRLAAGTVPGLDLNAYLEKRLFGRLHLPGQWPLVGAIDLLPESIDPELEAVDRTVTAALTSAAQRAVSRLLIEIGRVDPTALTDRPPLLRLLAAWTEDSRRRGVHESALAELAKVPAFPTIQGGRVSVRSAEFVRHVSIARWSGEWLGAGDGPDDALDRPILAVSDGDAGRDRRLAIASLAGEDAVDDVTDAVGALQLERRIARGLVARPTVSGADPALTRPLHEVALGWFAGRAGEIALVDSRVSRVVLHVDGRPVLQLDLDVLPAVEIAVEAPEESLDVLRADAQAMIVRLVRDVNAATDGAELPPWLRTGLRDALLSGRLSRDDVHPAPIFATTAGDWIGITDIEAQALLFGDVWAAPPGTTARPLDPRRIALALDRGAIARVARIGLPVIDGSVELELDEIERTNRDRPAVAELGLDPDELAGALSIVELEGDGLNLPRGRVAPLSPAAADRRGVRCHREMQTLGRRADPCAWPTIAVVDHMFTPDRTFSEVVADTVWRETETMIEQASDEALRALDPPPPDALASLWLADADVARTFSRLHAGRGWLWLAGPPGRTTVNVRAVYSTLALSPARDGQPIPVAGWVAFHPDYLGAIDHVLDEVYRELLDEVAYRSDALVEAHVAHALAIGEPARRSFDDVSLSCFDPGPLSAHEVASLLADDRRLAVLAPDEENGTGELALVDDGSPASRILIARLRRRTFHRERPRPVPTVANHPLTPLASELQRRLREIGLSPEQLLRVAVVPDTATPPVQVSHGTLILAGDSDRLRAIAAACLAAGAWSGAALDALAAHAIAVLCAGESAARGMVEYNALARLLDAAGDMR